MKSLEVHSIGLLSTKVRNSGKKTPSALMKTASKSCCLQTFSLSLSLSQFFIFSALGQILSKSTDSKAISVACFDVGEFVRFHPKGKSYDISSN